MKAFWEEMKYMFIILFVFVVIFFVIPATVIGIFAKTDSEREGVARCKSLQGEYGGGKCFKDGKER